MGPGLEQAERINASVRNSCYGAFTPNTSVLPFLLVQAFTRCGSERLDAPVSTFTNIAKIKRLRFL